MRKLWMCGDVGSSEALVSFHLDMIREIGMLKQRIDEHEEHGLVNFFLVRLWSAQREVLLQKGHERRLEFESVTINNHPMTYVESGQSNPRTLVLLSGWAQDDRLFKNLTPLLAKDFHVVVPNYRGHASNQTLHGDFTAADLVDDVEAFIKAKNLENVRILRIETAYALRYVLPLQSVA